MKYELAKRLKDAGFPQKTGGGGILFREGQLVTPNTDWESQCYAPTLSELIEACGDGFGQLVKCFTPVGWAAFGNCDYFKVYSTPEIAVANLWLALHSKE